MTTLTTGQVNDILGVTVAPADIAALGIKPAELVKGKPKWAAADVHQIGKKLAAQILTRTANYIPPQPADDDEL